MNWEERTVKNSVEMTIEQIQLLNTAVENGALTLEEAEEQVKIFILGEKKFRWNLAD